jgi:hypothetical protein
MTCRMCHGVVQYVGAEVSDESSASICKVGRTQKIEAACSFETFVFSYQTTRHLLLEKGNLKLTKHFLSCSKFVLFRV